MSAKERLDKLLLSQGFFATREKARSAVMAGLVFVNNQRVDKPGSQLAAGVKIEVKGNPLPYVSRGGLKLKKAIQSFAIDLQDAVVMDIGASTGGFSDCALQNGAQKVYAVDVGYGQLAWSLRQNPKVVVMERTNIRYLDESKLMERPEFVTIDVSFISLSKVLPKVMEFTADGARVVALIKPQFEAGPERVGKKGVVRDPAVHLDVIQNVIATAQSLGLTILGLDFSPVKGPEGNIEYLLYASKENVHQEENDFLKSKEVQAVVEAAHSSL